MAACSCPIRHDDHPAITAAVDAELNEIYGDDAEPSDTVLFDLLDCQDDPCPARPIGLPHEYIGRCGMTVCAHCDKVVG